MVFPGGSLSSDHPVRGERGGVAPYGCPTGG